MNIMSLFVAILWLHISYYTSTSVAVTIEWKPWINLPVKNSEILATTYQHFIYVIGGTAGHQKIYTINSSALTTSNQSWQTITLKGPNPGSIKIKNDNYMTIGHLTYILGPSLQDQATIYIYDHQQNTFTKQSMNEHQAASPCAVHLYPFMYVIGGTTWFGSDSNGNPAITCLSTTSAYNIKTNKWGTYSNDMPWTNNKGSCYNLCQQYGGFIYLFGGVIGGVYPTFVDHVYALDIRNGAHPDMKWVKVSNDSIDGGILNTHSVMVNHTIYSFSDGKVQRVELVNSSNITMRSIQNDNLSPRRCLSGNVYDPTTKYIFAIGGSDCNNINKYYSVSEVSQNMTQTNNNNDKKNWFQKLNLKDWVYFGAGFVIAILCVVIYGCCCRKREKNRNVPLISRHLQDPNGNKQGFIREEGYEKSSAISERPEVDI